MPVKMVLPVGKAIAAVASAAVAMAASAENMSGAIPAATIYRSAASIPAAMKDRATASDATGAKGGASTVESPAAMETAAAAMSTAAMAAADFRGESVSDVFRCGHSTRIDQRQRFGTLAGCGRQQQYRGSREPQATDKAAPVTWNLQHLKSPLRAGDESFGPFMAHVPSRHVDLRSLPSLN
jgi:hypothetical protein